MPKNKITNGQRKASCIRKDVRHKAFLFDLDGTLIDSEIIWVEAVGSALAEFGCSPKPRETFDLVYGRSWTNILADVSKRWPAITRDIDVLISNTRQHFYRLRGTKDIRIPGSLETLKRLAGTHPVAIVSGSNRSDIEGVIDELGIRSFVSLVLGCEDYSPGKPHPACYLLAASCLDVSPEDCLVFEDSAAGVKAAKAAGMACVALRIAGRPEQDLSEADCIVPGLDKCKVQKEKCHVRRK